ncbi:DUF6056 family protein [Streptomyces sp. NPDC089919]|uniref:DUF6056 family protein n=1 Tax=Streptomyces sp. NPDC089919 TaxID=3155188 RepID=UPI00343939F5
MSHDSRRHAARSALRHGSAVLVAAAGALLAVGAFLALYVRPTSDDWCAAWKARDLGVLGITADFYSTQNGRVTNAFLSGLLYSDGLLGPKLLPGLLILSLGAGLVLLTREALRLLRLPAVPLPVLLAVALVLEALLFFAGTRTYQVLLWAPATISHTLPTVIGIGTLLLGIAAARSGHPAARPAALATTLFLGLATGMLSEPFSLVSGLMAAVAGLLARPRWKLARDRYPATWCAAWCLGLLIGLVILYTSPGARWRRAQQPHRRSPLSPHELAATAGDWLHILRTIAGQGAYLGAVAVGLLLGLALAFHSPAAGPLPARPRRLTLALLLLPVPLVLVSSFLVALGLRSGYGPGGWTYARTWTNFMTPLLLALCLYGAWAGRRAGAALRARGAAQGRGPALSVALATALTLAALVPLVPAVQTLASQTVGHALAWDRQDTRIRAQAAAGARNVGYRPLYVGKLAEPFYTPVYADDWAARCVSTFYGVDRIHRA